MEGIKKFWKVESAFKGVEIFNMFFLATPTELEFNLNDLNILNAITVYFIWLFINPALCFYSSNFYKVLAHDCDSISDVE